MLLTNRAPVKLREGERVERDRVGEKKEKRGGPLVSADMRTPHRHVSKTAQKKLPRGVFCPVLYSSGCFLSGFVLLGC